MMTTTLNQHWTFLHFLILLFNVAIVWNWFINNKVSVCFDTISFKSTHHVCLVVHGEIKLNAFLWPEKETVKIWNFGSGARSLEVNLTSEGWRKTVHRNGAYNFWQMLIYMSPEQTGRTTFQPDHRTDLYSLGITFFVVLTQSMPFAHNSPMEIVHSVLNRKIPSLTQVRADVPAVVSSIIEKLTSKVRSRW